MNLLFGVSYLGTNYAGWQKQDNALGIEEIIENAIQEVTKQNVQIYASGRTDAGVHAYEQCFSTSLKFKDYKKLPIAINTYLPEDIRILWVKEVDKDFHARFSAHKKTYVYRVKSSHIENPFDNNTTTYVNYELDYEKMVQASKYFIGTHDFSAFCSTGTTVKDFVREIYCLNINKTDNLYEIEICGNGFLYNMVRIISGTLIDVGRGKILPEQIQDIMQNKDRQKAGKTMPAKGLILKKVEY